MPRLGKFTVLLTASLALIVLGLGLTTYTQSILHPGPASDLEDLVHRALGDRMPDLPVFSAVQTRLELTPGAPARSRDSIPADDTAFAWALAAARTDSAALRTWLSPATLRWARRDGDTVYLTLVRLTWHRGCPLVSRLHAVFSGMAIVRVRASCPVARGAPSPATPSGQGASPCGETPWQHSVELGETCAVVGMRPGPAWPILHSPTG